MWLKSWLLNPFPTFAHPKGIKHAAVGRQDWSLSKKAACLSLYLSEGNAVGGLMRGRRGGTGGAGVHTFGGGTHAFARFAGISPSLLRALAVARKRKGLNRGVWDRLRTPLLLARQLRKIIGVVRPLLQKPLPNLHRRRCKNLDGAHGMTLIKLLLKDIATRLCARQVP
jgi:hypothetical protein